MTVKGCDVKGRFLEDLVAAMRGVANGEGDSDEGSAASTSVRVRLVRKDVVIKEEVAPKRVETPKKSNREMASEVGATFRTITLQVILRLPFQRRSCLTLS